MLAKTCRADLRAMPSGGAPTDGARFVFLFGGVSKALLGLRYKVKQARSQGRLKVVQRLTGSARDGVTVLHRKREHAEFLGQIRDVAQQRFRQR